MQSGVDLVAQDVSAPALLDGLVGVPKPGPRVVQLIEEGDLVIPGQLCKRPLHNCLVRPRGRKSPHVVEIARRESRGIGKLPLEVG